MAKIYNVRNGGVPSVTLGLKQVNSLNVAPYNVVATAAGTALTLNDIDQFDMFNAVQTSGATDLIILPTAAPIGTRIAFFCVSACKVKAAASSGIGTNGGNDTQGITLTANAITTFTRASATNWIAVQVTSAGATSGPTAA